MKKIISIVLSLVIALCIFTFPCEAAVYDAVRLDVEYDKETKMMTLSGNAAAGYGIYSITFYLLKPGKIQQDIKGHSEQNPVIEHYDEAEVDVSGAFSTTFKVGGEAGIYTLYFQAGGAHIVKQLDLSQDITPEPHVLDGLLSLPTVYPKATKTTTKELFIEKRAELPDEMPVVRPAPVFATKQVFIDVENGNDNTAIGTIDRPFKTFARAYRAMPPKAGMAYVFREGTYPISDRIDIANVNATYKDPFIITNYKDEKVTFVGGTKLDNNLFTKLTDVEIIQRLDPTVVDDILEFDLPAFGITDYGTITTSNAPVLFVGESEYHLARWPNSGTTTMKKYTGPEQDGTTGVIDSGYNNVAVGSNVGPARPYSKRATERNEAAGEIVDKDQGFQFCITDLRPFSWVDTGDIWVYGRFYSEWTLNHFNISEFHPENGSIRTKTGLNWGCMYSAGNTFYYYNVLEELDAPGEWYLDKTTGKLYVYPTADLLNSEIILATSNNTLLQYYNMKNFIVNGINFEHARGYGINANNTTSENVIIQNCSFENLGNGVAIRGIYSGVVDCYFKNITGKAISLVENEANTKALTPQYLFAQNNVMYNTTGILANGVGPIISHNFISNNRGSCISTSTTEAVIEYNEIVGGPTVVEDSGAMYIGGNNLFRRSNHIRYNYIHDAPALPRAIYFDDMAVEYYAYGNIVADGGWMQIHNGSEHTVYNNIFINNKDKAYIIHGSPNYFTSARNGAVRWRVGSLEYGSMSAKLKEGSGYTATDGTPYGDRYPFLKRWAVLMQQRIDEYNALVAGGMDKVTAAKTSNISTDYYDSKGTKLNLNEYLAASRDNYLENNLMINTNTVAMGQPGDIFAGHVDTVYINNVQLENNPIQGRSFLAESTYDKIREYIPTFETIPFAKIGLLNEEDYLENAKAEAISPVSTADVAISKEDLSLNWTAVEGAQLYVVEFATDRNFNNIIEYAELYELSYKVISKLDYDTVYYWRVTTVPMAICSTGNYEVSDTFCFKTLPELGTIARNQVGVASYTVDDKTKDNFKVSTYAYNLKDETSTATIYVACYDDENKLIEVASETISIPANTIEGVYEFNITAPKTNLIKLFVWTADQQNITPFTFVKTIK